MLRKRLVQFLQEYPEPLLYGNETIFCDGERVGYLHVEAYKHTLGSAIGLGTIYRKEGVSKEYLQNENLRSG